MRAVQYVQMCMYIIVQQCNATVHHIYQCIFLYCAILRLVHLCNDALCVAFEFEVSENENEAVCLIVRQWQMTLGPILQTRQYISD